MAGIDNKTISNNIADVKGSKKWTKKKLWLIGSAATIAVAATLIIFPLGKKEKKLHHISSDKSSNSIYSDHKWKTDNQNVFVLASENTESISPFDNTQAIETTFKELQKVPDKLVFTLLYDEWNAGQEKLSLQNDTATVKSEIKEAESPLNSVLFMAALNTALKSINSLDNIKDWWIPLEYPWEDQWEVPSNRPRTIDLFPKKMVASYLPYSIIKIWKRMFKITPDLWLVVGGISLDSTKFSINVCKHTLFWNIHIKTVSKDRKWALWVYFLKLWNTWEKWPYSWSTVEEVPEDQQEYELEEFNMMNSEDE